MSVGSGHRRIILLGVILSLFLVFAASACSVTVLNIPGSTGHKVSKISVEPDEPLTPGTPVVVSVKVDFPADESGITFPEGNELQFSTDLDRATWEYYLVLDGREEPQPLNAGRVLSISGWVLSKPKNVEESLVLRMEGKAPAVKHTKNITIIKIQQEGDCGRTIGTIVEYNTMVFNVSEVSQIIGQVQLNLSQFRNHIDEKAAMGVNTTDAAIKNLIAKEKYYTALNSSPNRLPDAYNSLIASETAITEGEALLDKEWAVKTVADAEEQLEKANDAIDTIHENLNTTYDKRLNKSYVMRDRAVSGIALARDNISSGDFPQARIHANAASDEANQSYYEALDAQKRMADPLYAVPLSLPMTCLAVIGTGLLMLRMREQNKM